VSYGIKPTPIYGATLHGASFFVKKIAKKVKCFLLLGLRCVASTKNVLDVSHALS
jgi:hypothetical protein